MIVCPFTGLVMVLFLYAIMGLEFVIKLGNNRGIRKGRNANESRRGVHNALPGKLQTGKKSIILFNII